jgi:hypothetical protein
MHVWYNNEYCCLRKQTLFTVRTKSNTRIHSVGKMQNFSVLKQAVQVVVIGL